MNGRQQGEENRREKLGRREDKRQGENGDADEILREFRQAEFARKPKWHGFSAFACADMGGVVNRLAEEWQPQQRNNQPLLQRAQDAVARAKTDGSWYEKQRQQNQDGGQAQPKLVTALEDVT